MLKKILLFTFFACSFIGCQTDSEPKEILFVCTHGAARSPIAAAYFNKSAKENNLNYRATFRGTEPDKTLTKETIDGLLKDGFRVDNRSPQKVSAGDIETAYKVVTFDCAEDVKNTFSVNEEWNGTPSISKDYKIARNAIKMHVEDLIKRLKENSLTQK